MVFPEDSSFVPDSSPFRGGGLGAPTLLGDPYSDCVDDCTANCANADDVSGCVAQCTSENCSTCGAAGVCCCNSQDTDPSCKNVCSAGSAGQTKASTPFYQSAVCSVFHVWCPSLSPIPGQPGAYYYSQPWYSTTVGQIGIVAGIALLGYGGYRLAKKKN